MNFGEKDNSTGFYFLEFDNRGNINAEYIPIESQKMDEIVINAADIPEDEPNEYILEKVKSVSSPNQLLKLKLIGLIQRSRYHKLRIRDLWLKGNDLNFSFNIEDKFLIESEDYDYGGERLSQKEEIIQIARQLEEVCRTDSERKIIKMAKNLVLSKYVEGES